MQCTYVFFLLIALTSIQIILSFNIINDDQKQSNTPECLSKKLNRDRRASISRPYFRHWQQTRDNSRYSAKNLLAFSPRLGKRAYENENQLDNIDNKFVYRSIDLDKEEIHGRQTIGKHPVLFRYRLG